MANLSFSAAVANWVRKVEGAEEAVFKASASEVVSRMQTPRAMGGHMRVDTGFLRASLMASTSAMPAINKAANPAEGSSYSYDDGQIEAVIAGSEIGQTLYFGYTAAYSAHREYGARGQAPDAFVRTAAQQWQGIVSEKAADLKSRLGL